MLQNTGDYEKQTKDYRNLGLPVYFYTFTPRPLTSGGFFTLDDELSALLIQARSQLGILEGITKYIPDRGILQDLMMLKESHYSRLIDYSGDYFSLMLKSISSNKNKTNDVFNIVSAYRHSLSQNANCIALSQIYTIAMHGQNADIKLGVRKEAIHLSRPFSTLREYNPTAPEKIPPALADITEFLTNDMTTDVLVKAALAHYQFEMIHPFECYNGIIGRMMIPMIINNHSIKAAPFLGLSEVLYFYKNDYFDILRSTQYSGGYIALIKFFTEKIYLSAKLASAQIQNIANIIAEDKSKLTANNPSNSTLLVYEYFKKNLVAEIRTISETCGISYNTAAKAVDQLLEMNILVLDRLQSRNRKFVYDRLIGALSSIDRP